jgi:hypothetical protein
MSRPDAERGHEAMRDEISGMVAQEVLGCRRWRRAPRGGCRVGSMWVFSYKLSPDGSIARYKAQWAAKGFTQRRAIYYLEVWAPIGKLSMMQALPPLAAAQGYNVPLADVTEALLNGEQDEETFLAQPPGLDDRSGCVWRLRKALHGLKQAARAWHTKLRAALKSLGFLPSHADPTLLVHVDRTGDWCFIVNHADDPISIALGLPGWDDLIRVSKIFAGKESGLTSNHHGMTMELDQEKATFSLSQACLVEQVPDRFGHLPRGITPWLTTFGEAIAFFSLFDTLLAPLLVHETLSSYVAMVGCL